MYLEFSSVWYYPKVSRPLTTRQCDLSKWQNVTFRTRVKEGAVIWSNFYVLKHQEISVCNVSKYFTKANSLVIPLSGGGVLVGFVGTIAQTGPVTSSHYLLPTASNHQITVIPHQPVWQKQNICVFSRKCTQLVILVLRDFFEKWREIGNCLNLIIELKLIIINLKQLCQKAETNTSATSDWQYHRV